MEQIIKVFSQTLWQVSGKAITSVTTLFLLGFVSRSFGSSGVGYLTLALSYIGFFALFVDLGLNGYLLPKFLESNYEKVWQKLFGLRLLMAAISVGFAYTLILLLPGINESFKNLVLIGAFIAIFEQAIFSCATVIFQSKLRYDLAAYATTLGYIGIIVSAAFANYFNLGLGFFMLSYAFGWIILSLLSLILVFKFTKTILPEYDLKFIKNVFKSSWPISATLILNLIYFRLDSFFISWFRNFSEVGIYNLAYQVFQSALVLPVFIMNGYYPLMVKNLNENKDKFLISLKKAFILMLGLGFAGTVATFIFGDFIINIIAGNNLFSDSATVLKILSLGFPLFFISALLMWVLVTLKEYKILVRIYFFGLVVNIVLNLIFIPQFSYIAASIITVLSEGVILVLQILFLRKKLWK